MKNAYFAGGCFWCIVDPYSSMPGVEKVTAGYMGGHTENPTYEEVCSETTGHKEAVEIVYDESLLSYEKLVEVFFKNIDPTDPGGQFADRGTSYQTAIFTDSPAEKEAVQRHIKALESSGRFKAHRYRNFRYGPVLPGRRSSPNVSFKKPIPLSSV